MYLDALIDTIKDCLKLLPFLFAAYLLIEILEKKAASRTIDAIHKAGRWGPFWGSALGLIPQCGFSAATANLYVGGILTRGTLIAVFLSTSDEMLPILISSSAPVSLILKILACKFVAGIIAGFLIDFAEEKLGHSHFKRIHEMCENEDCDDNDSVIKSALIHTVKIFLFLFVITLILNILVAMLGTESLQGFILNRPVIGEFLAGLIGLIPNCAASVVLTTLYLEGGMSIGALVAGLLTGSGVGLIVLCRMNHSWKDTLLTVSLLYGFGVLFGLLIGVTGILG